MDLANTYKEGFFFFYFILLIEEWDLEIGFREFNSQLCYSFIV